MDNINRITTEISQHSFNADMLAKGYQPLFAASTESRIVVIGQAPGIRAQTSMIPWDDASGRRLREWMGISDEVFYNPDQIALMPMDFYFPGKGKSGDLPPRKGFAEKWHPRLLALMPNVKLTLLAGQYAQGYYLGDKKYKTLTETVKNYREYLPKFFPIPHPSPRNGIWLRKNQWFEEDVLPVMKRSIADALK